MCIVGRAMSIRLLEYDIFFVFDCSRLKQDKTGALLPASIAADLAAAVGYRIALDAFSWLEFARSS